MTPPAPEGIDWSPEKLRNLLIDALALEFIRLQQSRTESPHKSRWHSFMESSAGAALITVLIGGIFGTLLTAQIQNRTKQKDLDQLTYKEFLNSQQKTVEEAYASASRLIVASNNLITATTNPKKTFEEPRIRVVEAYNAARDTWDETAVRTSLELSLEHPDLAYVTEAWDRWAASVAGFAQCAAVWSAEHPYAMDRLQVNSACQEYKGRMDKQLASFTSILLRARQHRSKA
jgi:hypothetical protein